MKKFIFLIMILMFAGQVFGATYASKLRSEAVDGTSISIDSTTGKIGVTAQARAGGLQSSETPYYVDSVNGADNRSGKTWDLAVATVSQAVDLIAAAKTAGTVLGDPVIYWRENSSETITAASQIELDASDIRLQGMGYGSARPQIIVTASSAYVGVGGVFVSAGNCWIDNVRFYTASRADYFIRTNGSADNLAITRCLFEVASPTGSNHSEVVVGVDIRNFADDCYIGNNRFKYSIEREGAYVASGIAFAAVSGLTIEGNICTGDSGSWLTNSSEADDILVLNNIFYAGTLDDDGGLLSEEVFAFNDDTSGLFVGNKYASGLGPKGARVVDSAIFIDNSFIGAVGDEYEGLHAGQYGDNAGAVQYIASSVID